MAGSKLTALTDLPLPALTDKMYIVRPSLGAVGSLSVTVANLRSFLLSGLAVAFPPDTSVVGNVGAGVDALHTFTLPANSLRSNGDYLRVRYSGKFASNNNDKRILITFDAQTASDTTLADFDLGDWIYDLTYIRLSSTTVRVAINNAVGFVSFFNGAAGGSGVVGGSNTQSITVANLNSNAVTLLVSAEATADNDVTQNLSILELVQF